MKNQGPRGPISVVSRPTAFLKGRETVVGLQLSGKLDRRLPSEADFHVVALPTSGEFEGIFVVQILEGVDDKQCVPLLGSCERH